MPARRADQGLAGRKGYPRMSQRLPALVLLCALIASLLPPIAPPFGAPAAGGPGVAHAESAAQAHPQAGTQRPVPINDRLGLAFISSAELADVPPQRYQQALNAGVRWNRWPIYWGEVVKQGGYARQDANFVRDHQFGLQINAILIQTPDQFAAAYDPATYSPEAQRPPRVGERADADMAYMSPERAPLATGAPRNLYTPVFLPDGRVNPENYWAAFVYQTVMRYKPGGEIARQRGWTDGWGIRHWEVWNEADSPHFWTGSLTDYYQLLKVAYVAIKAADPEAKVLLGGLAYWMNKTWFPQLLAEMARDPDQAARRANNSYFDILPLHWYSQPVLLYDKTVQFRRWLEEAGLGDKAIWVNETNVPVYADPGAPLHPSCVGYAHSANPDEQANFVIQAVAYGLAAGVERIFLFQHYDDGNGEAFGMFRNNGEARPAYAALQFAATYFRDARRVVRETHGPVERITFWGTTPAGMSGLHRVAVSFALDAGSRVTWFSAQNDRATLLQRNGQSQPLGRTGERYILAIPRATALDECNDPNSGYIIGGDPALLIEPLQPDPGPPTTRLLPLAEQVCDLAIVRWQGRDPGWGIESWDVQVRDLTTPDAPWQTWLSETTATSGIYKGQAGRVYAFRARARDNAGNVEPFPEDPARQVRTTITACPPRIPSGGMLRNGNFEEPNFPGWGTSGSTAPQIVNDARTGGHAVALGKDFVGQPEPPINGGGNSSISQQITVPANAPRPFLGYWYAIDSDAPAPTSPDWHTWAARFEVIVIDAGGKGNYVDVLWEPTDWSYRAIDLTPWRGQKISVVFNVWQSSAANTTVARLDDVAIWADRINIPFAANTWTSP